ncbi:MAG: hypothetical protein LQ339_005101 [Xanthoria mediterranea]|nr:MAG: hypothetical protein LQ339_005101 [Xanthoria mediterranea]
MASEDRPPLKSLGSVLVVGGCGFLGSHIVRQLLDSYSCDISVLDLRTTTNRYPNVSYHEGNITSLESLRPIFSSVKPAVIIHTASPAFTSGNAKLHQGKARSLFHSVNVTGTSNLLTCASEISSVQAFIYTSSSSVIHDTVSPLCNANESYPVLTSPFQPEYYAETKALAESLVLAHNRHPSSPHLFTASIRPAGIFGEGDLQLIAGMMKALAKRQTAFQLGPNTNLFDFTYVGNAAHAHILAAIALLTTAHRFGATRTVPLDHERADGQAFFITNAQPVYFWDFARAVWATAGDPVSRACPAGIWTINETLGLAIAGLLEWIMWVFTAGTKQPSMTRGVVKYSCMTRYFDTGKAKSVLGYTPVWGLDEGVERTVRWWKEREQGKVEPGLGEKAVEEGDEGEMRSEGEKVTAVVVET